MSSPSSWIATERPWRELWKVHEYSVMREHIVPCRDSRVPAWSPRDILFQYVFFHLGLLISAALGDNRRSVSHGRLQQLTQECLQSLQTLRQEKADRLETLCRKQNWDMLCFQPQEDMALRLRLQHICDVYTAIHDTQPIPHIFHRRLIRAAQALSSFQLDRTHELLLQTQKSVTQGDYPLYAASTTLAETHPTGKPPFFSSPS